MAATQTVFLKHTFIGKSKQDQPYTARAHSRYIQRQSETHSVYTHLLPENYNARQRWFFDHENNLRRNGRVIDKFTISIPHAISQEHAVETLARFGKWLGQDRCPFMFTLQGFDSPNHHAHFVFIDKDYETGERIVGTTERHSTRGIKLEWERVANEAFEELGYDIRVKVKEGYELQAENDNQQEVEAVSDSEPAIQQELIEPAPTEDVREDDSDMVETTEAVEPVGVDAAGTLQFLHDQVTHLNYLHHCQDKLQEARERVTYLEEQLQLKTMEAGEHEQASLPVLMAAQVAQERLADHLRPSGGLKGRSISLFGYNLYKSAARKTAEKVQAIAEESRFEADAARHKRYSYEVQIARFVAEQARAQEVAYARQAELENLYGTAKDMNEAEAIIRDGIREATLAVSPEKALAAYEGGEVTIDQYRAYLHESGMDAELQLLEEGLAQDGGQSL